ncbi:fumarylacetoacetate hydrolase family protein [Kistimonas scapharcae]|uniref:Fumarylacetoacetate hydrolase family protein n=1 Tax=Kistimonas scapharcae TaxID=1036133 RepID=A0ABP8V6S7_9GAMM
MKLASLADGRDGKLVVVSRDLKQAAAVPKIAGTLQQAMDDWDEKASRLNEVYELLNRGEWPDAFGLEPEQCGAPLPRAFQWLDGSAYVNHVELVRKARGAEMPENFWTDPLMYQGVSDNLLGPCDDVHVASEDWGIDFEAEVVVLTDDVPMGVSPEQAASHIKLLTLVNDVSLRNLIPAELGKGFGFLQSKPASAFAPVVVTPDELGDAWQDNKVHLPLRVELNNELFGQPNCGVDMTFDFARLISHAAMTRHLGAGTLLGSGTISNTDRSSGSCCLAEQRMLEIIEAGEAQTPFLRFGDHVRIEMLDAKGKSVFGAIDQRICQYEADA